MSFAINLGINNSEKVKLDKTVTYMYNLTGTLRDGCSITNPIILVESENNLSRINYVEIPEFNRVYFVTDIETDVNGLWNIHLHCDVLSSFKTGIRSNTGVISKQENDWNLYIDDGSFKVYQQPNIVTNYFPSGFSTSEFILAVAGG